MDRRSALVLLVVFGIGVFLAGLELIVTAVALPSILVDLVEPTGGSAWIELRKASWIVNGYLLAYVVTMPLSGRLADLWGARRLFMGALVLFVARPVGIALSLLGTDLTGRETVAVGWFGPKGFASVFFAFLIVHSGIAEARWLFSLLALVITASIVAHSSTDILVARWFVEAERDSVAGGREVTQSGH